MQQPLMGIEIAGYGIAVPENRVSNEQLIEMYELNSSDEKIQELAGIKYRHLAYVGDTEATAYLSAKAGLGALGMAGVRAAGLSIDSLLLATTTPDRVVPATAPDVKSRLKLSDCYAYDVKADCSGFEFALIDAYRHIATGEDRSLVIGTDVLSRYVDWKDRSTAILFGDGSGAVLLQKTDREEAGLLSYAAITDGSLKGILYCMRNGKIRMDGHEVYANAVKFMTQVSKTALERAGLTTDDLDLIVPHQANKRIVSSAANRLGVDESLMVWEGAGEEYANTSSASIPIALAVSIDAGRVVRGDTVLTVGFGAGMSAVASVIRY